MSNWETFKQSTALADQLFEAAGKEQLTGSARMLTLGVAHYKVQFGEAPIEDFNAMLRPHQVDAEAAAMLTSRGVGVVTAPTQMRADDG